MEGRNNKGQFEKGHIKEGGKQKGYVAPNVKELRSLIAEFTIEKFEAYCISMMQLEPKDFVKAYQDMLKFVLPTLQSVALENTKGIANALTDKLRNLAIGKE